MVFLVDRSKRWCFNILLGYWMLISFYSKANMKVPVTNGVIFYFKKNLLWKLFALPTSQARNETISFFLAKTDSPFSTCNETFYSTIYTAVPDGEVPVINMLPSWLFLAGACRKLLADKSRRVIWLQLAFSWSAAAWAGTLSELCIKHFPSTVILENILFLYQRSWIPNKR